MLGVWNIGRARYYHEDAFESEFEEISENVENVENLDDVDKNVDNFDNILYNVSSLISLRKEGEAEKVSTHHEQENKIVNLYASSTLQNVIQRVKEQSSPERQRQLIEMNKKTKTYNLSLKFQGALRPSFLAVDEEHARLMRKVRIAFNRLEEKVFDKSFLSTSFASTSSSSSSSSTSSLEKEIIPTDVSKDISKKATNSKRSLDDHYSRNSLSSSYLAPLLIPLAQMYMTRINGEHFEWFYHDIIGRGTGGNGDLSFVCKSPKLCTAAHVHPSPFVHCTRFTHPSLARDKLCTDTTERRSGLGCTCPHVHNLGLLVCGDSRNTEMLFAHPFLRTLVEPTYHKVFDEIKVFGVMKERGMRKEMSGKVVNGKEMNGQEISGKEIEMNDREIHGRSDAGEQIMMDHTKDNTKWDHILDPGVGREYGLMEYVASAVMASTKQPPSSPGPETPPSPGAPVDREESLVLEDNIVIPPPSVLAKWFSEGILSPEFREHSCPLVRVYVELIRVLAEIQIWEEVCAEKIYRGEVDLSQMGERSQIDESSHMSRVLENPSWSCQKSSKRLRAELFDSFLNDIRSNSKFGPRGLKAWRHSILRFPPILYAMDRLRHTISVVPVKVDVIITIRSRSPHTDLTINYPLVDLKFSDPFKNHDKDNVDKHVNLEKSHHFNFPLHLPVHPFRERASDLTRRNHAPYCNVEVLRIVVMLAMFGAEKTIDNNHNNREDIPPMDGMKDVAPMRIIDIGSNMGDCIIFLLKMFPSFFGTAVEAIGPSAERIRVSKRINGISDDRLQVKHGAVSLIGSEENRTVKEHTVKEHLVIRAPRSSWQRGTVFCEGKTSSVSSDSSPSTQQAGEGDAADGEVWPSVACSEERHRHKLFAPNPHLLAPREWVFFKASKISLEEVLLLGVNNESKIPIVLLINTIGHELQVLQSGYFTGRNDPRLPDFIVFQVYGLGQQGEQGQDGIETDSPASSANQLVYQGYYPTRIWDLLTELGYGRVFRLVDVNEVDVNAVDSNAVLHQFHTRGEFDKYVSETGGDFDVLAIKDGDGADER